MHLVSMVATLLLPLVDTSLDLYPSLPTRFITIHDLGYARSFGTMTYIVGFFDLAAGRYMDQGTTRHLLQACE